jgi:tripartite-type tricarboxylate transporter receptor subunit TctC
MIQRKAFLNATFLAALGVLAAGTAARAQEPYPTRPIRIVVTFGAGGSGDILARGLGEQLSQQLGQPVLVDNRAGGNAMLGTQYVAHAPADGYTILQYTTTIAVNTVLQPSVPYDLFRDFTPVAYTFYAPLVLLTPGSSHDLTIPELVAHAKAKGKGLSYGHGGVGSMSHLSGELFKRSMHIDAVSVGYKGNAPAFTDLLGGRLDYYFSTIPDVLANIKAGRLHALAVTSPQRDPMLPEVPTMVELGYKDFTPVVNWGYLVPKNTPPAVVRTLQDAMAKALASPAMQERLAAAGASSKGAGGPDVMTAMMKAEIARWEPVIKAAHIKPE